MKTKYLLGLALPLIICSCSEKKLEPITGSMGKPGVVTVESVESTAGGAIVTYRIPNSEDILGVKAVFTRADGKEYNTMSSYYENKVIIEGFNDTNSHQAKLYTFNRAQELSDPVAVDFTPLQSSLSKVAQSMSIISDFGGAQFKWENADKAPLNIEFIAQDSVGMMQIAKIITTGSLNAQQSIRGYDTTPRKFAAVVRDNFGNASDTIYPPTGTIVPMFEEKLDKRKMTVMKLGNDASFTNWEGMDSYIIDDDYDTFGHSANSSIPAPFTIDLGVTAKLSRFAMFQRKYSDTYYNWGNPKSFTVWICDHQPDQSGNWSEWKQVLDCVEVKPSGSPGKTVTDEDIAYAEAGFEFTFELTQAPVRYIRFVVTSTWEGTSYCHPAEVTFYGQVE